VRLSEISLFGLYIAPIAGMLGLAWIVVLVLRWLAVGTGVLRHVWHPALFGVAIYVIVVSCLVLATAP
jgi:protein AaeX